MVGSLAFSLRFMGTTQLTSLPALPSLVHFLVGRQESDPPRLHFHTCHKLGGFKVCEGQGSHPWSSQGDLRVISSQADCRRPRWTVCVRQRRARGHGSDAGAEAPDPGQQRRRCWGTGQQVPWGPQSCTGAVPAAEPEFGEVNPQLEACAEVLPTSSGLWMRKPRLDPVSPAALLWLQSGGLGGVPTAWAQGLGSPGNGTEPQVPV